MLRCQDTHNMASFPTDGQGALDILHLFSDGTFYLKLSPPDENSEESDQDGKRGLWGAMMAVSCHKIQERVDIVFRNRAEKGEFLGQKMSDFSSIRTIFNNQSHLNKREEEWEMAVFKHRLKWLFTGR